MRTFEASGLVKFVTEVMEAGGSAHEEAATIARRLVDANLVSVHDTAEGIDFKVTDGNKTVTVDHRGDKPELFKNGAPVVCEGRWAKSGGFVFDSDRIMIKHGSDYTPPKVDTKRAPKATSTDVGG